MPIQTYQDYAALQSKIEAYDQEREKLFPGETCFTPEMKACILAPEPSNEERSDVEVWKFQHIHPEKYFAYVNNTEEWVTTWTGQRLGTIISRSKPYRSNFGDTRVSMRIRGINGALYSATYFQSAGAYCRMKRILGDKP